MPAQKKSPFVFLSDPVVRMIVSHWVMGMGVGALAAGLFLALDVGGMRSLILRSDAGIAGIVLLFAGFSVTFGGVISASAVMFNPGRLSD